MIQKIIAFSFRQKGAIWAMLAVWIAVGLYSLHQLPIDAVPDITNNQVQVITTSQNYAAQEMELFVTAPLEMVLSSLPDKTELRSISRFGLSVITVVFKDEVDVYKARQMVTEKINQVSTELPKGVSMPELGPPSTGLSEIYQYTLDQPADKPYSLTELRTMQDWIVKRQLLGTEGLADVSSFGGLSKELEISIDPQRLRQMDISLAQLVDAVEKNNANTGSAYIEKQPNVYYVRGEGLIQSPEALEQVVVAQRNGSIVLLKDVAKVGEGASVRYGAMTKNGKGEAVGGIVLMLKGRNSEKVIRAVKDRMIEIQKSLPKGVIIKPFIDRTKLIDND